MKARPEIRRLSPREVARIGERARSALEADAADVEARLQLRLVETVNAALDAIDDRVDREAIREFRSNPGPTLTMEEYARIRAGEPPLRVWRKKRRMKAKDLAAEAGVSASYVSDIEHGRRTGTLDVLRRIATALDLDLDDIA